MCFHRKWCRTIFPWWNRTVSIAETPILWPPHAKSWLIGKDWCWEGLGAGGEGDDRGWDGWMASPTRWTWVWVNSGSWWWTGRPGVLWFMGSQSRTQLSDWTELNSLNVCKRDATNTNHNFCPNFCSTLQLWALETIRMSNFTSYHTQMKYQNKQTRENGESSHWGILLPISSESSVSTIPADEQSQATTKVTIPLRCKKKKAREKENN